MELINYEYYKGKRYEDLDRIEKGVLHLMYFDWILRPKYKDDKYGDLELIVRFADENQYRLEASVLDFKKYNLIVNNKRKNAADALKVIETPLRICRDEIWEDTIIGDYKEKL